MVKNSLTSNATWNIMARIVPLAIAFILTPILISRLGIDYYGLYMLIMSLSGMLGLMSLGLGDATIRYVAYYGSRKDFAGVNRVFRATLSVYLVTGICTLIIVLVSSSKIISLFAIMPAKKEIAITLLQLTGVSFLFSLVSSVICAIPQAFQRYDVSTKITFIVSFFQAIITVGLLLQGYGIVALVGVGIATNVLSILLNTVAARHLVPELNFTPFLSKNGLKEVFGYGLYSFVSQIFGTAFSYSDRLITGIFISSTSVGYLTVPQDLALRALSLVGQGGSVLFPKFSTIEDSNERAHLYLNATWAMIFFSSILFVPLTVFISDFISLWISKEFAAQCSMIGQLIAFSSIIRGAFVPYEALFKGINKPQYITVLAFVVGFTSLGINWILIPRYGLAGAGYSYCISALWGVATLILTWKYVLHCKSFSPLIRTVLVPLLLAMICVGLGFVLKLIMPPINVLLLATEVIVVVGMTAFLLITFEKWLGKDRNCAEIFLHGIYKAFRLKFQKVYEGVN